MQPAVRGPLGSTVELAAFQAKLLHCAVDVVVLVAVVGLSWCVLFWIHQNRFPVWIVKIKSPYPSRRH